MFHWNCINDIFYCAFQMCITASQIQWTADVTKALGMTKERGDQKSIKSLKKKQASIYMYLMFSTSTVKEIIWVHEHYSSKGVNIQDLHVLCKLLCLNNFFC